ncbi:secreted RxLR effector protein 161-like [Cryptomeria japonica]|uniref:secreted RxLR effector protein 161-like n=1 Tax=Cryptomeria japonica TaxID=3369 RepID=UPI0025ACF9AB|nr:secreted RxLR effector protein 161-like [Cryptomeria japonica]
MTAPKVDHWVVTKCVLRYVKGTSDFGLLYSKSHDPRLIGYTNSDWAGSVDDRKSTSGYVFSLGSGAVTWTSKKQQAMALSSTKAKYRGTVKTACEAKLVEDGSVQLLSLMGSFVKGSSFFLSHESNNEAEALALIKV